MRAADGRRRKAPLLGAAGARLQGQAGRPTGTVVFDIELLDTAPVADDRRRPTSKEPPDDAKRTATGLAYKVLRPGTGVAQPGGVVDASPCTTRAGRPTARCSTARSRAACRRRSSLDDVIAGWTEGVQLMVEGERTRFWIPQDLAYKGEAGSPRGMLVFDIELIEIE